MKAVISIPQGITMDYEALIKEDFILSFNSDGDVIEIAKENKVINNDLQTFSALTLNRIKQFVISQLGLEEKDIDIIHSEQDAVTPIALMFKHNKDKHIFKIINIQ